MRDLSYTPNHPNLNGWKERHLAAIRYPLRGHESAIVDGFRGWIDYAKAHKQRFESTIGDDGFLGPAWARWGFALRDLLNGETGRLDCGTLDSILCTNLSEMGFDPDQGAP